MGLSTSPTASLLALGLMACGSQSTVDSAQTVMPDPAIAAELDRNIELALGAAEPQVNEVQSRGKTVWANGKPGEVDHFTFQVPGTGEVIVKKTFGTPALVDHESVNEVTLVTMAPNERTLRIIVGMRMDHAAVASQSFTLNWDEDGNLTTVVGNPEDGIEIHTE